MSKRLMKLLLAGCVFAAGLWAADDPFVGEWKVNGAKSKLVDIMKVESVGANKYVFDFGGSKPEVIVVDGTDQPGLDGTTLSVMMLGPDAWKVVRKKDGHVIVTGNWKLSQDGETLSDDFTYIPPNGAASNVKYEYKRTAGKEGFAGTWESTSAQMDAVFVLQVRPYEGDGLTFITAEVTKSLKFDGKDYPKQGPNVGPGSAASGRRVNERTLELTDKVKGKTTGTQRVEVSADLKTLTITIHPAGKDKGNVFVFDRQ